MYIRYVLYKATVDAPEYVDSGRSSKEPAGRVSQREKVTDTKASSKVVVDSNTLKAAQLGLY